MEKVSHQRIIIPKGVLKSDETSIIRIPFKFKDEPMVVVLPQGCEKNTLKHLDGKRKYDSKYPEIEDAIVSTDIEELDAAKSVTFTENVNRNDVLQSIMDATKIKVISSRVSNCSCKVEKKIDNENAFYLNSNTVSSDAVTENGKQNDQSNCSLEFANTGVLGILSAIEDILQSVADLEDILSSYPIMRDTEKSFNNCQPYSCQYLKDKTAETSGLFPRESCNLNINGCDSSIIKICQEEPAELELTEKEDLNLIERAISVHNSLSDNPKTEQSIHLYKISHSNQDITYDKLATKLKVSENKEEVAVNAEKYLRNKPNNLHNGIDFISDTENEIIEKIINLDESEDTISSLQTFNAEDTKFNRFREPGDFNQSNAPLVEKNISVKQIKHLENINHSIDRELQGINLYDVGFEENANLNNSKIDETEKMFTERVVPANVQKLSGCKQCYCAEDCQNICGLIYLAEEREKRTLMEDLQSFQEARRRFFTKARKITGTNR